MAENNMSCSSASLPKQTGTVLRTKSIVKEQVDVEDNFIINADAAPLNRSMETYIVIWLKSNTDESTNELQHTINLAQTFLDPNECVDFLTDVNDEKVFLIISDSIDQLLISLIEDVPQLRSIYVFASKQPRHTSFTQRLQKMKGVFTQIDSICNAIKQDASHLMTDLTPFSIISTTSSPNLDELDQSFMYTQLIKELILEIEHDADAKEKFVQFYQDKFCHKQAPPKVLEQFQRSYEGQSAILWYAREGFLFETLNKALRTQDTKTIIKMAFFLRDLHQEIQQRHSKAQPSAKVTVYRGQGMSNGDFEQLKRNEGGLLSFNCFLSTSVKPNVSSVYADSAHQNRDLTGVLFRIEVDPSISSIPYVNVNEIGYSQSEEEEILFTMHTVFRIGQITEIDDRLWEVTLTLTSDNDQQLTSLTDYIRKEIGVVASGWYRIGLLMQKLGKFDDSLEIYINLLENYT